MGPNAADHIRLICSSDETHVEEFRKEHPLSPHRINAGRYETLGRISADSDQPWHFRLVEREGVGDGTVLLQVARGSHSEVHGKMWMQFGHLDHADMLLDAGCQQAILAAIEKRLEKRIRDFERRLRGES